MITIHKQVLKIIDQQKITIPHSFVFLHVAAQEDDLCIWYKCNTEHENIPVNIDIYGTGHELKPDEYSSDYIGSAVMPNGLVWHVFESYRD